MPTVDFMFFDAGGGHRAAATALKAVIDSQNRGWHVRLVNLQELLDQLDVFRKVTGIRLEDIYNLLLAKDWTLGSAQMLVFMHAIIRMYHRPTVRLLERHWREAKPDLVVSFVPNFNRAMFQSLTDALPGVPYVTIITDFADYPPHFWIEPQDQYLICGTDRAVDQARRSGYRADRMFRVSGMVLRPTFYEAVTIDRRAARAELGLDPERPTGLVLFGGQGSSVMLEIARRLNDAASPAQLILICGKNDKLAQKLKAMPARIPMHVEGFTTAIPRFMATSDFFIGKPGPGSISEALAMKLPVIIQRSAWTLPQERYNAEWVLEKSVGIVLPGFRDIDRAVRELLEPDRFATVRSAVENIENRAVFEIPDILAGLLR